NQSPWGLQRVSCANSIPANSCPLKLNYQYQYEEPEQWWNPVDVYIIDSGVQVGHSEFGGRARFGVSITGGDRSDILGHGTHVAGIVGGTGVGVAKTAQIIAVNVGNQRPWTISVIGATDWVIQASRNSWVPSIANLSLGYYHQQKLCWVGSSLE
ncbi:subtilisin-like serine protease, partial [Ceratobasidium sp. 395]